MYTLKDRHTLSTRGQDRLTRFLIMGLLVAFFGMMIGCAGSQTRDTLPVVGTLLLVERGVIQEEETIQVIQDIRAYLEPGRTLVDTGALVRDRLEYSEKPRSAQVLIDSVLFDLSGVIPAELHSPLDEGSLQDLHRFLNRIEAYLRVAEGQ